MHVRPSTALWHIAVICVLFCFADVAAGVDRRDTMDVDGRTRSYILHVPPTYDGKVSVPLVLVLHGATQSAEGAERMSGFDSVADRENFVVVYPRGSGRLPTWNAGNCCGYALRNKVDDVAFLRALIHKLEKDYRVDSKRIYATGISNGAMMSYRVACELADQVAAVAPVEGAQNVQCRPSSAVSVVIFHGTADHLVPFEGGTTPFQIGPRRSDAPVKDAVAFWVRNDGCSCSPQHEESNEVHIDSYSACKDGTAVALYAIQGGHHLWPGTRGSGNSVQGTEIMWRFFAEHPKR